jgi:predicted N-formylglutamate amidohydrolase
VRSRVDEHVEVVCAGDGRAGALFTCEHASERLPEPWRWTPDDEWIRGTHWAYDLGAAELARELARELDAVAVLSRFSRLLADPNRPEHSPDLCRASAEGRAIRLNAAIDSTERERRLTPWRAYHDAVDLAVAGSTAPIVFAVHTFTPVYEGAPREVEVGVLFDEETALADRLHSAVAAAGFRVAMNEPYSGKLGLMYAVDRHARRHGRRPIELELRQDLAMNHEARSRIVAAVREFLRAT